MERHNSHERIDFAQVPLMTKDSLGYTIGFSPAFDSNFHLRGAKSSAVKASNMYNSLFLINADDVPDTAEQLRGLMDLLEVELLNSLERVTNSLGNCLDYYIRAGEKPPANDIGLHSFSEFLTEGKRIVNPYVFSVSWDRPQLWTLYETINRCQYLNFLTHIGKAKGIVPNPVYRKDHKLNSQRPYVHSIYQIIFHCRMHSACVDI